MRQLSLPPIARLCLVASVAVNLVGCRHFHHNGPRGVYALAPAKRPLEVPPSFDPAAVSSASSVQASLTPHSLASAPSLLASPTAFRVRLDSDQVFERVGAELARLPDVKIVSRERTIGSFAVNYQSTSFIVRILNMDNGESQVGVMDARGAPADSPVPMRLLAHLKTVVTPTAAAP